MISIAVSSSLRRAAIAPARNILSTERSLSMACANSVHKLNGILEEYREKNYSQEFPRRFQKDIVKAASEANPRPRSSLLNSTVSAEGIAHVLRNIGMGHRMSRQEIEGIVKEVGTRAVDGDGEGRCVITEGQMLDLISRDWEGDRHGLERTAAF